MPISAAGTNARALWFAGPRQAELRAEEVPAPGPREVQVRTVCSLVSAGTEMSVYRGQISADADIGVQAMAGGFSFPVKFGYQVVGTVVAAGPGAGYQAGDGVFVQHPHQEVFNIPADAGAVFRLPAGMEPDRAAFLALYRVAVNCLLDPPVRVGDCVAVSGLGVVGSFCAQLARKNADRLVLIDPSANRRELARWIGADKVVAPGDAPAAIAEMTRGRGVDVFIEASGSPAALQTAVDTTGFEGTIGVVAWYGTREVSLDLGGAFHLKRLRIVSSWVGRVPAYLSSRWTPLRQRELAARQLAAVPVGTLITDRVPFGRAPDAYALIDTNAETHLAVLLDYQPHERDASGGPSEGSG